MFTATGMSFQRLPSGFFQAEVAFEDDATKQMVLRCTYVVLTKMALRQKVSAQLQVLKDAVEAAAVDADVIGQVLGTI